MHTCELLKTGVLSCCQLKVWSLFSAYIFKNMMNNCTWTLIIWRKRKTFIYFIKCYWIKNLLPIVIQNKKYLVVFHKHESNSLCVYYLISYVIFGLFIFFYAERETCVWSCVFWFSQSFYFTAFLSINIEIVSKGSKTKTCINKSFDLIITKCTLHVLWACSV